VRKLLIKIYRSWKRQKENHRISWYSIHIVRTRWWKMEYKYNFIKWKMWRVSARRLSIYNFVWELLKATKKVYLIPQKWRKSEKKTKIHMESIWESLQAQLAANHKKNYRNTKSTNRNQKKSQIKVCLVLQKWKKAKNSHRSYQTEFAGSTQNIGTTIRTKFFPKEVCLVP
jgi:hypothetical protein